jgi:hypothetical protein
MEVNQAPKNAERFDMDYKRRIYFDREAAYGLDTRRRLNGAGE